MKMDIKQLKKEIPYQWRVQSFSQYDATATCVAYIDARDVMDLLDEVVGSENWMDEYYQVKNTLCCKIGIKISSEWVWKTDGGTVTDVEAEKGELSDAFKRAAVKWGVGRFLYNKEIVKVKSNEAKKDKTVRPYVVDDTGNRVWDLSAHINKLKKSPSSPTPTSSAANNDPLVGTIWKMKDGTFAQVFYNPTYKKNGYATYPDATCDRNHRIGYLKDYEFDTQKVEQIT